MIYEEGSECHWVIRTTGSYLHISTQLPELGSHSSPSLQSSSLAHAIKADTSLTTNNTDGALELRVLLQLLESPHSVMT